MPAIDSKRLKKITNELMVGDNALSDAYLLNEARNYKKFVASRYRLFGEKDIKYLEGDDLRVSKKIDGQLHFLACIDDECFLFNTKGRVISGPPWLADVKKVFSDYEQVLLAGELYCNQGQGTRARVYDVTSALAAGGKGSAGNLSFAVFDVVQLDDKSGRGMPHDDKQAILEKALPEAGCLHRVDWQKADAQVISKLFNQWVVEEGEEGLVCLDEQHNTVYKIKPRHNIDAVIVGYTESPDTPDSLRVLLTALMRPDGTFQLFAKVGTGFDDEQRREFYRLLKPMKVESTFKTADRNHTLFTMVRPEVIIEMAFHDLIWENASGRPEMKAVLEYDEKEGYQARLPEPFVSALGPVFKRIRDDKEVNPSDLRLMQLQDFVDLDNLEAGSRKLDYAKSEVISREVYTKTTKGLMSVRKFIAWKTNKDDVDADFPAFVFCFVDYSPGRKAPLKRVLRTAPTEEAILKITDEFKEAEIKKGWELTK